MFDRTLEQEIPGAEVFATECVGSLWKFEGCFVQADYEISPTSSLRC
jgi:hypothetical protein